MKAKEKWTSFVRGNSNHHFYLRWFSTQQYQFKCSRWKARNVKNFSHWLIRLTELQQYNRSYYDIDMTAEYENLWGRPTFKVWIELVFKVTSRQLSEYKLQNRRKNETGNPHLLRKVLWKRIRLYAIRQYHEPAWWEWKLETSCMHKLQLRMQIERTVNYLPS